MNILKEKTYKNYDYVSRYTAVPYFYNTVDNKYIYGIGTQMNKKLTYIAHKVLPTDTLDSLALTYYNNPTYYWVIAYFNDILDCYGNLIDNFEIIKIPNISSIAFGDER